MAYSDKLNADHLEYTPLPEHEAQLSGAIALASLFSNCVEAFGLIHPSQRWDREEQLLLTRLGLQQARLLIWASVLGVASPPASVTDRAVPKHPSLAYPDLKEPTFFDPRDPRLDDPQFRTTIESTLSTIVERTGHLSREEMMGKFGLKLPKRFVPMFANTLDMTRLESFREKYELLREVAETYAHLNTRRSKSIVQQPWMIADCKKFAAFIQATQEKVDFLIDLMGVKERVDLACRMDIRVFGWHISADRSRIAEDISKLKLLQTICTVDYPEYLVATQQALDNISRESRESAASVAKKQQAALATPTIAGASDSASNSPQSHHKKRPGLIKLFKSFSKHHHKEASISRPVSPTHEPEVIQERSKSDAGPSIAESGEALARVRSKSLPGTSEPPMLDETLMHKLEKLATNTSQYDGPPASAMISRHDQYHGLSRVPTKNLHQADY